MKIIKHSNCSVNALSFFMTICAFFLIHTILYADDGNDRLLVENKLKLADYILAQSEMIKNVMASNNQEGKEAIDQAKKDFLQAKFLLESNEVNQANNVLTGLLQSLSSLSLSSDKKTSPKNAMEIKYKELVVTIKTLMDSMQTELDQLGDGKFSTVRLENILATAETLARESRYQQANSLLAEVYYNLKLFIKQQRDNKTLVYSLDFKSMEDEYEYELRRYKSFSMLMDMSLKKNNIPEKTALLAGQYMLEANEAKLEASILAKNKKFTEAIRIQEQANQHLIRALRTVGLMIP